MVIINKNLQIVRILTKEQYDQMMQVFSKNNLYPGNRDYFDEYDEIVIYFNTAGFYAYGPLHTVGDMEVITFSQFLKLFSKTRIKRIIL